MIRIRKLALGVGALVMVVGLAACQDSEQQAETHYQNALSLLAEGDTARASIEFRNVFQNNGQHREARQTYAAMLRETGDLQQSYSQYLRLVEQFPEDIEGRIALAEMAIEFQNWEEALRHGERALDLAPDHPAGAVIRANIDYFNSFEPDDPAARRQVADRAAELLEDDPENMLLERLVVDNLISEGALEEALARLEGMSAANPTNRGLYDMQLMLLVQLEREDEAAIALRDMITQFPDDTELPGTLLRFLVARGQTDEAETFLRDLVEVAGDDAEARLEPLVALVRLRLEVEGPEAAIAELDQVIAVDAENAPTLRLLRASLQFETGDAETAIAELEGLLEQDDLPAIQSGQIRVTLAQMLMGEGNIVGARRLVEEVLEGDSRQPDALKMLAAWLIEEDATDRAIAQLRIALDSRPEDAEAMTLMAQAYARNGNRELANEFMALAVEASGSAPEETLRYAQALMGDERYRLAEEILIDALRLVPGEFALLSALGDLYLETEDWSRAEQVAATLRRQDTPLAISRADELQVRILQGQGRAEEALALLEGLAGTGTEGNLRAQVAVIQTQLANGDSDGALTYVEGLLNDDPESVPLRMMRAVVHGALGDLAAAEAGYRDVLEDAPDVQDAWIGLIRTLSASGDRDAASTALNAALEALPNAPDLLWAQASYLEELGDIEGAIALYERLYETLPNAPVVANNLASLLSTYRDDEESLERAFAIARRLRGIDVAPFQDTYGWIAYRRGEYEEALAHLEPAAEALTGDPLVQYHLGMTYRALGRNAAALERLTQAVEIAGPNDARPQFESANAEIAAIEAELGETGDAEGAEEE